MVSIDLDKTVQLLAFSSREELMDFSINFINNTQKESTVITILDSVYRVGDLINNSPFYIIEFNEGKNLNEQLKALLKVMHLRLQTAARNGKKVFETYESADGSGSSMVLLLEGLSEYLDKIDPHEFIAIKLSLDSVFALGRSAQVKTILLEENRNVKKLESLNDHLRFLMGEIQFIR